MGDYFGLDFETYGSVNLPAAGLANYTRDPFFTPLIASLYSRDKAVDIDFVEDWDGAIETLRQWLSEYPRIAAHNAGFEREVLKTIGFDLPAERFIDSAVVARAVGAGSKLEAAAPQLLGIDKIEQGSALIKLFSIPGKYQEDRNSFHFYPQIIRDHPQEWADFKHYCSVDARLGFDIVAWWGDHLHPIQWEYHALTLDMNQQGWTVDLALTQEMNNRYHENMEEALATFRKECGITFDEDKGEWSLNLNSHVQLQQWCLDRGIKAKSFDEKNVARLLGKIEEKMDTMSIDDPKWGDYSEVQHMLQTKQILGGSSLKKLKVILDTAVPTEDHPDVGKLHDQYMHIGAGQTWRTTGRSVQMQNLKRLGAEIDDVDELWDLAVHWPNEKLAKNIRQLFMSKYDDGVLMVGDFSSVESRGLAYQAGEGWKLEAYRKGQDIYKLSAAKQFSCDYDSVTKDQRQFGKVGELSCGYGAGPDAVQGFAEGMGVMLTNQEAAKIVVDWRDTNPSVVKYWHDLDAMLQAVVSTGKEQFMRLPYDGAWIRLERILAPGSLHKQAGAKGQHSLVVTLGRGSRELVRRFFHGIHRRGRNVGYFKPSELKGGDLWRDWFTDQKTKQVRNYELYGGKLSGILTQSLCRELFFDRLVAVRNALDSCGWYDIDLVGQFHDEIVIDVPGWYDLYHVKDVFERAMSYPELLPTFPLAAEIKWDHRYTK